MLTARRSLAAGLALVVLTGCGGGSDDETGSDEPVTSEDTMEPESDDERAIETDDSATTAGPEPTEPPASTPAPETTTPVSPTTAPASSTTAPIPLVTGAGIAEIELLTPTAGNDHYAVLEWTPLEAAAVYTVTVFTADGRPWWAWSGDETAVPLGGLVTDRDLGGPSAGEGVTWFVVARDPDGRLVGVSARREVS